MRGDRVGAPRRAIPTADTHVEPAQRACPIFLWAPAEDDEASPICIADAWRTCRV
jgi:hypothetical protein